MSGGMSAGSSREFLGYRRQGIIFQAGCDRKVVFLLLRANVAYCNKTISMLAWGDWLRKAGRGGSQVVILDVAFR